MANIRDVTLDYAKGFAILLIVLFHVYGYTGGYENSIVYSFCQNVQIVIFIFVSGVLISKSSKAIDIKSKAVRLLVPFISFYIIWGGIDYHNFTLFILDEFKYGYWFVLVLFEIMLIYAFLFYIAIKANLSPFLLHIVFLVLLSLYEFIFPRDSILNILICTNLVWHYYPFFILGIYSWKFDGLILLKYTPIYLFVFILSQYYYFTYSIRSVAPLCNLSSLLFFMSLFKNGILPLKKLVAKLGVFSMQIYLLHFILLSVIYQYIPLQDNCWIEFLIYLLLSVIIISFIVIVSHLIMRNKWARFFLFGIKW